MRILFKLPSRSSGYRRSLVFLGILSATIVLVGAIRAWALSTLQVHTTYYDSSGTGRAVRTGSVATGVI
jgi:hypothetical protein